MISSGSMLDHILNVAIEEIKQWEMLHHLEMSIFNYLLCSIHTSTSIPSRLMNEAGVNIIVL